MNSFPSHRMTEPGRLQERRNGTLASMARTSASPTSEIEVFFDGDCPLCRREVGFLRRRDQHGRILFTDIASPDFDADAAGVPYERLMDEIHGRLPDGRWVRGVEVFRRLYAAVGWRQLAALSRWSGISQALDLAYRVFASNRLRLTGRCGTACTREPRS